MGHISRNRIWAVECLEHDAGERHRPHDRTGIRSSAAGKHTIAPTGGLQIHLLRHRLFGTSSEKRRKPQTDPDNIQLPLFNEAEVEADAQTSEETGEADAEVTSEGVETETITYERRKPRAAREREAWL